MQRPEIMFFIGDDIMAQTAIKIIKHIPDSCNVNLMSDFEASGYQVCASSRYSTTILKSNQYETISSYVKQSNLVVCTMSDIENGVELEAFKFACEMKKPIVLFSPNYHTIDLNSWKEFSYHSKINANNIYMIAQCDEHARNIKNNWHHLKHIHALGNPLFDELLGTTNSIKLFQNKVRRSEKLNLVWRRHQNKPPFDEDVKMVIKTAEIRFEISDFNIYLDFDDHIEIAEILKQLAKNNISNILIGNFDPGTLLKEQKMDIVVSSSDSDLSPILALGLDKPVCILTTVNYTKSWYKDNLNVPDINNLIPARSKRVLHVKNLNELETAIHKALKQTTQKNLLTSYKPYPNSAYQIGELIYRLAFK